MGWIVILHAQRAVNQHREDLLREIGIRADLLGLCAHALDHDALASRIAHDGAHGRLGGTDLSRLGQSSTNRNDDLRIDNIEFGAQS